MSAEAARLHLQKFRGIGHRQLARLAKMSWRRLRDIRVGRATTIRASTETKILALAVRQKANQALVSSWRTKKLVAALVSEGWTVPDIAAMLGLASSTLRCPRPCVRVITANQVENLYQRLMI